MDLLFLPVGKKGKKKSRFYRKFLIPTKIYLEKYTHLFNVGVGKLVEIILCKNVFVEQEGFN